jgi:hypothetical protein
MLLLIANSSIVFDVAAEPRHSACDSCGMSVFTHPTSAINHTLHFDMGLGLELQVSLLRLLRIPGQAILVLELEDMVVRLVRRPNSPAFTAIVGQFA